MQAHIERCRKSYVDWETASLHVPNQGPIERKRVQSLLESMDGCTDPKLCARLATISNEALGMLNIFEDAVAHLLPACPVALSSPPMWLLVVTTVFTEGGLGVNGNLLN